MQKSRPLFAENYAKVTTDLPREMAVLPISRGERCFLLHAGRCPLNATGLRLPLAFDNNREDNTCHGIAERSRTDSKQELRTFGPKNKNRIRRKK